MPLFTGTQQGYYQQNQSWEGDNNTLSFNVTTFYFATRPIQQADIQVFINGIEINKDTYTYNGTSPGDTTADSSYNIVFHNTNGINSDVQQASGAPNTGLDVLFREIIATEQYGTYQYIKLRDLVNNFMISYVGEGKIIPKVRKADVLFHAQRSLQELSYDTLRSSKSQEIDIPPSLTMKLPHDYVNYIKISYKDADGIERLILPARNTSNPKALLQDDNYNYLFDNDGTLLESQNSETWKDFKAATEKKLSGDDVDEARNDIDRTYSEGRRFGLDPQYASSNGLFYIDKARGKIHFSGGIVGKTVTIKYISDSLGTDDEMEVHKFAEEAVYKWIAYAIASTHTSVPPSYIPLLKRERFAAIRTAKLRLSNLKSEEIAQVMRGKSKFIKH